MVKAQLHHRKRMIVFRSRDPFPALAPALA
jgi:hypothetical protein